MGEEQDPPDAGVTVAAHDGSGRTSEEPAPPLVADDTVPARVRAGLSRYPARRVAGLLLLVAWLGWGVALWVVQPRLVPESLLADDLAGGRVTSYHLVTVEQDREALFSGRYRIDLRPVSQADEADAADLADDGSSDGTVSGQQVTVAYWVDSPVASLRVLDPDVRSTLPAQLVQRVEPAQLVQRVEAGGVPRAPAADLFLRNPAPRTYDLGALLLLLTLAAVVMGPRPSRGTRWFWFWILGAPVGVAVPLFAVGELLLPRHDPAAVVDEPGRAGRWSGLTGFAAGFVLSLVASGVLLTLGGVSPLWFIRG